MDKKTDLAGEMTAVAALAQRRIINTAEVWPHRLPYTSLVSPPVIMRGERPRLTSI